MKRMWSEEEIQSFKKNISNLVDSKGNPRFIEGEGTPLSQEGVTISYCKWSLSGTHLMCVLAGNLANTISITEGIILATFNFPNYIKEKIIPVWQQNLAYISQNAYADNGSSQGINFFVEKTTNGIRLLKSGALTLTANRSFRIQVDLLIDSE